MKKILLSGLVLASLSFGACEKFLDVRQPDVTPYDVALKDVNNVEALMRTAYNDLQGYGNFMVAYTMMGDECDISRQSQDQFGSDYITRNFGRFNGIGENLWSIGYSGIYRANQILKATNDNQYSASQAVKDRLKGEAYFIRGFYHFELCRTFALPYSAGANNPGIVIRTSAPSFVDDPNVQPRATVGQSYQQAINDLRQAIALLPENAAIGRMNKDAAKAILMRIYFNMDAAGQATNYQEALNIANELMNTGKYKITRPWNTWAFATSKRGIIPPDTGVIAQLVNTLADDAGGSLAGTFWATAPENIFCPLKTGPGTIYNKILGEDSLRLDTLVLFRNSTRPTLAKWTGGSGIPYKNTPLVRYAEVLLTAAEAIMLTGGDAQTALGYVNVVRASYNLPLIVSTDAGTILQAIRDERAKEMLLEGDRYHELRRLRSTDIRGARFDDSKSFFQIPNSEQRANPGIVLN